jgi:hypothetical protein
MTLAKHYNNVDSLLQNEALLKHCLWVGRQRISKPFAARGAGKRAARTV